MSWKDGFGMFLWICVFFALWFFMCENLGVPKTAGLIISAIIGILLMARFAK